MNVTLLKALIALVPVAALFLYASSRTSPKPTAWSSLLLLAALCFGVVVFTHVAEALHLFPAMAWGEPHSVGHYVDLTSAIAGVGLLILGIARRVYLLRARRQPLEIHGRRSESDDTLGPL